jgi:hypothetical protein
VCVVWCVHMHKNTSRFFAYFLAELEKGRYDPPLPLAYIGRVLQVHRGAEILQHSPGPVVPSLRELPNTRHTAPAGHCLGRSCAPQAAVASLKAAIASSFFSPRVICIGLSGVFRLQNLIMRSPPCRRSHTRSLVLLLQRFKSPSKPSGRVLLPAMSTLTSTLSRVSVAEKSESKAASAREMRDAAQADVKSLLKIAPRRSYSARPVGGAATRQAASDLHLGADSWETVSSSDESTGTSPRRGFSMPSMSGHLPAPSSPLSKRASAAPPVVDAPGSPKATRPQLAPMKVFSLALDS